MTCIADGVNTATSAITEHSGSVLRLQPNTYGFRAKRVHPESDNGLASQSSGRGESYYASCAKQQEFDWIDQVQLPLDLLSVVLS